MKKTKIFAAVIFFIFSLLFAGTGFTKRNYLGDKGTRNFLNYKSRGESDKLYKVHSSLFETFMPLDLLGRSRKMDLLVKQKKKKLWEKFSKMEQVTLAFGIFKDLRILTSKSIIRIVYKFVTKETEEIKNIDKKSLSDLKDFLNNIGSKKLRPSVSDLTREERLQLFELMIRSKINLHRHMAFSVRNAYMNYIYFGKILKELSGIDDNTNEQANPLPKVPIFKTPLAFNPMKRKFEGELDYIIVGSGVAGSVVAQQLQKAGKKVLVLEKGSFVVPGSIKTYLNWEFLVNKIPEEDNDGSIFFLNSSIVGGGSSINNGFSFPPTLPYIKRRFRKWRTKWTKSGRPFYNIWSPDEVESAYAWVKDKFRPRVVGNDEINNNNLILKNGFLKHKGVEAKRFDLFRYKRGHGPTEVYNIKSSVETLLFESLLDKKNPLTLIPDAKVTRVLMKGRKGAKRAIGVEFQLVAPRIRPGVLLNPFGFRLPKKRKIRVYAKNVILSAGNLGSTMILKESRIKNPNIGRGFTTHPYVPIMGEFERDINAQDKEMASIYVDHYLDPNLPKLKRGFLLESAASSADIAGLLDPSLPQRSLRNIIMAKKFGGMGVMLIDESNPENRIESRGGKPQIFYKLSARDKKRMAYGLSEAAKILLKSGAKRVIVLTYENILGKRTWKQGLSIKTLKEADYFEKNLKLVPNQNLLMGAHMLGANKLGVDPKTSVVDPNHQVWGINQLYIVDASILPESPGANPMTTIYTVAKLFAERHLQKLEQKIMEEKAIVLKKSPQYQKRN